MNKKVLLCNLLFTLPLTAETTKDPLKQFFNITPVTIQFNRQNADQATSQNSSQSTLLHQTWQQITTIGIQLSQLMKVSKDIAAQKIAESKSFLSHHKTMSILSATSALYATLLYNVTKGNNFLGQHNLWSSWKSDTTLHKLYAMPRDQLSQELLIDVQTRYTNIENPTDFMLPLIRFLYEIDQEIHQLRYYSGLNRWICRLHIAALLPINDRRFAAAQTRLKRALFCKNLFLTWAAQYKIDHQKGIVLQELKKRAAVLR